MGKKIMSSPFEQGVTKIRWRYQWKGAIKTFAKALLPATIIVVEARDMYHRGSCEVCEVDTDEILQTGDLLFVSNCWYRRYNPSEIACCFLKKLFFKSSWDEVAVVVMLTETTTSASSGLMSKKKKTANILRCDHHQGVVLEPLSTFLMERQPRGVAVRSLQKDVAVSQAAEDLMVRSFIQQASILPPKPWAEFRLALMRGRLQAEVYDFAVSLSKEERSLQLQKGEKRRSAESITKKEESISLKQYYFKEALIPKYPAPTEFSLTSGSMVAAFWATFGWIGYVPSPVHFVTADYSHAMPLKNCWLGDPIVLFR